MKRSFNDVIEDSKYLAKKKPKLNEDEYVEKIKIPSVAILENTREAFLQ